MFVLNPGSYFHLLSQDFTTSQKNHLCFNINPMHIQVQQVDLSALQGQSQAPEMTLCYLAVIAGHAREKSI